MERAAGVGKDICQRGLRGFNGLMDLGRDGEVRHEGGRFRGFAEIRSHNGTAAELEYCTPPGKL